MIKWMILGALIYRQLQQTKLLDQLSDENRELVEQGAQAVVSPGTAITKYILEEGTS